MRAAVKAKVQAAQLLGHLEAASAAAVLERVNAVAVTCVASPDLLWSVSDSLAAKICMLGMVSDQCYRIRIAAPPCCLAQRTTEWVFLGYAPSC